MAHGAINATLPVANNVMVIQAKFIVSKKRVGKFNEKAFRKKIDKEMQKFGEEIKREFEDITSDWASKNRLKMTVEMKIKTDSTTVTIKPQKQGDALRIFQYVDGGTKPHIIKPKASNKTGRLFFNSGYKPKTLPIARAHVGPGISTGPLVAAQVVHHPGTKPRLFTATIMKKSRPIFRRRMENAFKRATRKL